jgi:hypothetical protein
VTVTLLFNALHFIVHAVIFLYESWQIKLFEVKLTVTFVFSCGTAFVAVLLDEETNHNGHPVLYSKQTIHEY